ASTEGIFTETAGGVTVGCARKLYEQGRISPDETTVLCITGNGLKTTDALAGRFDTAEPIPPKFAAFENYLQSTLELPVEVAWREYQSTDSQRSSAAHGRHCFGRLRSQEYRRTLLCPRPAVPRSQAAPAGRSRPGTPVPECVRQRGRCAFSRWQQLRVPRWGRGSARAVYRRGNVSIVQSPPYAQRPRVGWGTRTVYFPYLPGFFELMFLCYNLTNWLIKTILLWAPRANRD